MNSIRFLFSKNYRWISIIIIVIIYYELKLYQYKNPYCSRKDSIVEKLILSEKDDFLYDLIDSLNKFLRFGNEYQNFILSLVMRTSLNETILISSREVEILKDLNK
jgi:hypothetical protein